MSVPVATEAAIGPQEPVKVPGRQAARLWPAWVVLILQGIVFALSITSGINNAARFGFMMLGPAAGTLLFAVWLLLASRIAWRQRLLLAAVMVLAPVVVAPLVHDSLRLGLFLYGGPLSMLAAVIGLRVTEGGPGLRRAAALGSARPCGAS